MQPCKTIGCVGKVIHGRSGDYCHPCDLNGQASQGHSVAVGENDGSSLADLYPKYHKRIPVRWKTIDVYGVHHLFGVTDPSGMVHHASKKLLLSGVRTGGKSAYDDIREARDTLNRYLELNAPEAHP